MSKMFKTFYYYKDRNGAYTNHPVASCKIHKCVLTKKQVKLHKCIERGCPGYKVINPQEERISVEDALSIIGGKDEPE